MSVPRSGSTYLFKMIAQSPDITQTFKEPFNFENINSASEQDVYDSYRSKISEIMSVTDGVLIKDTLNYVGLLDPNIEYAHDFSQLFSNFHQHVNDNFYKIKIYRRDVFEQALSNCVASITDKWVTFENDQEFSTVTVDLDYFKSILDVHKNIRKFLVRYPCDTIVYYEDLIDTLYLKNEWIFNRLQQPKLIKPIPTVPNPPKDKIVINYYELVDWYEKNKHHYEIEYDN